MGNATTNSSQRHMVAIPEVLAEDLRGLGGISATITVPIKDSTDSKTKIHTIPCYITSNFNFSLSNNWRPLIDSSVSEFIDRFFNFVNIGTGSSQFTLQSRAMQSVTWSGSSTPEFTFNTVFVSTARNLNPLRMVKILGRTCLPILLKDSPSHGVISSSLEKGGQAFRTVNEKIAKVTGIDSFNKAGQTGETLIKTFGLAAPLDYGLKFDTDQGVGPLPDTTVTLQIGDWFLADKLVVKSVSNIEISKEVIAPVSSSNGNYSNDLYNQNKQGNQGSGFPLYVKCSITFMPYTLLTPTEFDNYFINSGSTDHTSTFTGIVPMGPGTEFELKE